MDSVHQKNPLVHALVIPQTALNQKWIKKNYIELFYTNACFDTQLELKFDESNV